MEDKIKETKIVLNTEGGQVSFRTEKMRGKLCSLILDSSEMISIIIESEHGYLIFKKAGIMGTHCLSIRNRSIAPEESMRDITQFEEFYLNERLVITIMGQSNKEVMLIFRLE